MLKGKLSRRLLVLAVAAAVIAPAAIAVAQGADVTDTVNGTFWRGTVTSGANAGMNVTMSMFKVRNGRLKIQSNKPQLIRDSETEVKLDGGKIVINTAAPVTPPGPGGLVAAKSISIDVAGGKLDYTDAQGNVFSGAKVG